MDWWSWVSFLLGLPVGACLLALMLALVHYGRGADRQNPEPSELDYIPRRQSADWNGEVH